MWEHATILQLKLIALLVFALDHLLVFRQSNCIILVLILDHLFQLIIYPYWFISQEVVRRLCVIISLIVDQKIGFHRVVVTTQLLLAQDLVLFLSSGRQLFQLFCSSSLVDVPVLFPEHSQVHD